MYHTVIQFPQRGKTVLNTEKIQIRKLKTISTKTSVTLEKSLRKKKMFRKAEEKDTFDTSEGLR